jgi:hypothetical protein
LAVSDLSSFFSSESDLVFLGFSVGVDVLECFGVSETLVDLEGYVGDSGGSSINLRNI